MQAYEGVLPNVDFAACSRIQLQEAYPKRFFPCPEADNNDFSCSQQLRQHLGPEQIACIQQGSTAWHQARSRHITGSRIGDLLGFNSPKPNRLLVQHGVYHAVTDRRQAQQQLQAAVAALRGGVAAGAAAAELGAFGTLCCAWGCKHEAAALHTLLHYAPAGSCLMDSGFITLSHDTVAQNPDLYQDIFSPPQGSVSGSMGVLNPQQVVETLRLGCSLDGLLALPASAAAVAAAVAGSPLLCVDKDNLKRAPPYTWITQAGYKACVVEVKCPAPFYPVSGQPWAFGMRSALSCQPYKCLKAHYYCQAQLNMLITGTDCCVFVVWTRTRSWLLHIPINKPWLHTCLHLLMTLHDRYVAPHQQQQPSPHAGTAAAEQQAGCSSQDPGINGSSSGSEIPAPPDNLFWYDQDPSVRKLYRNFIVQTAGLAAAMRSDTLPDPLNLPPWRDQRRTAGLPQPAAAAAAAKQQRASTPPPGWNSDSGSCRGAVSCAQQATGISGPVTAATGGSAAAVKAPMPSSFNAPGNPSGANNSSRVGVNPGQCAAAAGGASSTHSVCWIADASLGTYSCLVKSVNIPWSKQELLQRNRWFLDRCDPDDPSQPHMKQAWLDHPLLEHTLQQPQGMMALLQLLHESQRPEAAPAGTGQSSSGGLSPGPIMLAMLLKMEQVSGLQLQQLWQQLPPGAQQYVDSLKSAMGRLAADSTVTSSVAAGTSRWYTVGASLRPLSLVGPGLQGWAAGQPAAAQLGMEYSSLTAGVTACSLLGTGSNGVWDLGSLYDNGRNGAAAAVGLDALWQSRRRAWGGGTAAPLQQQRRTGLLPATGSLGNGSSKHARAKRVVGAARQRQQVLTRTKYQSAIKQWSMREMIADCGHSAATPDRVWLDQPVHVLLQQAIAQHSWPQAAAGWGAPGSGSVLARLLSKKRKLQEQKLDQLISQQQQQSGCGVCCPGRTQSAPAVLQTGHFVAGGVRVNSRTGRKVFRRKFLSPTHDGETTAATVAKVQQDEASSEQVEVEPTAAAIASAAGQSIVSHAASCACVRAAGVGTSAAAVLVAACQPAAAMPGCIASITGITPLSSGSAASSTVVLGSTATMGVTPVSLVTTALLRAASGRAIKAGSAAAGPGRPGHRRSKSCPCLVLRRRSPTMVQQPPAADTDTGMQQPAYCRQSDAEQRCEMPDATAGSVLPVSSHSSPAAPAAVTGVIAAAGFCSLMNATPPSKWPVLGWCNLGNMSEPPGPRFSPGAAAAAAASSKPWHRTGGGFKALLRSRRIKGSNRRRQAVECTPMQQHLPATGVGADVAGAAAASGGESINEASMQQQVLPPGNSSLVHHQHQQQHHRRSDSATGGVNEQLCAASAEDELDDLLASGALDEILGRSIEDWRKLVLQ